MAEAVKKRRSSGRVKALWARGFDQSRQTLPGSSTIHVSCSQCQALVINGVACHETGCPHDTHECAGCNEIIPARQKYCEQCS